MQVIDNRTSLFELDEIYKYKNLIDLEDKLIIKDIICNNKEGSKALYQDFLKLVADEVDHQLNKSEFKARKVKLINKMEAFLEK